MSARRRLLTITFVTVAIAALCVRLSKRNSVPSPSAAKPAINAPPVTQSLSQQMTERLLALLRAETDPAKREAAAQQAAQHLPRALLEAVLADLQRETDRALAMEAARAILLRWAWEEPTGAAAWTMQFASAEIRRDALAAVGAGWARQNPEALLTWASTLPPVDRDWVLLHGASYLARTDLGLFAVWSKALPRTRELEQLTAQTAREWASRDPRAVANALGDFSGPEHSAWRKAMASGLASQLVQANNAETALAILDAVPPGLEKQQVLKGVVIGWTQREPAVVASWLESVSDSALRTEIAPLLAGAWFEQNTAAAEKWAVALPPGPVSDAVAERAAQYFAPRDRAAAQRWASRIGSTATRTSVQAYVQAAQPLVAAP
ncbi:MAG: hypothetical protein QM715_02815 [Nibricoccus sp.]